MTDCKIIEGCVVYSYEVVCPAHPHPVASACAFRRKSHVRRVKKTLLGILLILLMPFAALLDCSAKGISFAVKNAARVCRRAPVAGAFGVCSCAVGVSALLLLL